MTMDENTRAKYEEKIKTLLAMAKKKKKNAKKLVLGILIAYVAIMALGYMGVSYYFSSHFLKGTTISGMDSSSTGSVICIRRRISSLLPRTI